MKIVTNPTGNTIRGHVLDVSVDPLEQALRDYDPQLYVKWNPKKLKGWGCWEVRRKPESMVVTSSDVHDLGDYSISTPRYKELDVVNHVMDVPYLNYLILKKIHRMDIWALSHRGKNFVKDAEYAEAKYDEKLDEKSAKELEYNLKQMKHEIRYFREYVLSGGNPYRLADHWS